MYFEPYHIQYLPIRHEFIEIIGMQVAETDGRLTINRKSCGDYAVLYLKAKDQGHVTRISELFFTARLCDQ